MRFQTFIYILIIFFTLACQNKEQGQSTILKQWHLSPSDITTDIEKSKLKPQFNSQKETYLYAKNLIEKGDINLVIAEGCEGEIKSNSKLNFNGWTLPKLIELNQSESFADILAPIPMKLKAKFPSLKVICGDNQELIKKNLLAMSDLRGFFGFYSRLLENLTRNPLVYENYAKELKKLYPNAVGDDPIEFSRERSQESLELFMKFIYERNNVFKSTVLKNKNKKSLIIIGGLHADNLKSQLESFTKVEVVSASDYPEKDKEYIEIVRKLIEKQEKTLTFLSTPAGFILEKFPIESVIKKEELFTPEEEKSMRDSISTRIPFEVLLSDFDQDGVRDFTVATKRGQLVLVAEDTDWDNDGINNQIDETVGLTKIVKKDHKKNKIQNTYFTKTSQDLILKKLSSKITIIPDSEQGHELLVLEVLHKVLEQFPYKKENVLFLKVADEINYDGRNVFFYYQKNSKTLGYFPNKLRKYFAVEFDKRFKGANYQNFVTSFVLPVLIHSIAHELAHSHLNISSKLLNSWGWSWKEVKYKGKYLNSHRSKIKELHSFKEKLAFQDKDFASWINEYQKYQELFANKERLVDGSLMNIEWKKSKYYLGLKSMDPMYQMSFLQAYKIPSVYSLSSPDEFYAETISLCFFQKLFPNSTKKTESVRWEHLIGINPGVNSVKKCKEFKI